MNLKLPNLLKNTSNGVQPAVELLPASLFFCKTVDVPSELDGADLQAFAELSLEEHSPFPIEQMVWGCCKSSDSKHLLIYAALRARINKDTLEYWESPRHIFPAFLPILKAHPEPAGAVAFLHGRQLGLITFIPGTNLPKRIHHSELPGEDQPLPSELEEALAKLAAKAGVPAPDTLHQLEAPTVGGDGGVTFPIKNASDPATTTEQTRVLDVGALWNADLRDDNFIKRKRRELAIEHRLWQAMLGWGVTAATCIVLTLVVVTLNLLNASSESHIAEMAPVVDSIEGNLIHIDKLDAILGQPFEPFAPLEVISRYAHGSGIEFNRVTITKEGQINLRGFGYQVDPLNNFLSKLTDSGLFTLTERNSYEIRKNNFGKGGYEFDFTLRYDALKIDQAFADNTIPAAPPPPKES